MDNIEQQVKKVVAEQLSINEADIKNESAFISDLGADSLDTVELVMALKTHSASKFLTTSRKRSRPFRTLSISSKLTRRLN